MENDCNGAPGFSSEPHPVSAVNVARTIKVLVSMTPPPFLCPWQRPEGGLTTLRRFLNGAPLRDPTPDTACGPASVRSFSIGSLPRCRINFGSNMFEESTETGVSAFGLGYFSRAVAILQLHGICVSCEVRRLKAAAAASSRGVVADQGLRGGFGPRVG